jgi:integrase
VIYRPTYRDSKTGSQKTSEIWWIDFTIGNKRIRESAQTTRKTIALAYEDRRRLELERAFAGLPTEAPERRINTAGELVAKYLSHYPLNHRPKSVLYATQRLAHVTRVLGSILLPDLTEDRIRSYMKIRLGEQSSGRTINMELGELSRSLGQKWSVLWPNIRKIEENHDVGQALSPEEEAGLLGAAAADTSPNRNPMLYPFLCVALSTAMRSGEIAKLRWHQIDLEAAVVTVGRAKTRAGTGGRFR